jgi:hypothetical protein
MLSIASDGGVVVGVVVVALVVVVAGRGGATLRSAYAGEAESNITTCLFGETARGVTQSSRLSSALYLNFPFVSTSGQQLESKTYHKCNSPATSYLSSRQPNIQF